MRIIQTYWHFEDMNNKNIFDVKGGWKNADLHWLSWAFSCYQIRKFYDNLTLYTNNLGKIILIDTLKLPYTDVILLDDNLPITKSSWVLAKIHTYSQQTEPFIHIDGDIFIFKKFEDNFLNNEIVVQNFEINLPFYSEFISEIKLQLDSMDYQFLWDINNFNSINAGIFGGYNLEFIKYFCKISIEICADLLLGLENINVNRFCMFVEQFIFYKLACNKNIKITPLLENAHSSNYVDLVDFVNDYIHVLGIWKYDDIVLIQMLKLLKKNHLKSYIHLSCLLHNLTKDLYNKQYPILLKNNINKVQTSKLSALHVNCPRNCDLILSLKNSYVYKSKNVTHGIQDDLLTIKFFNYSIVSFTFLNCDEFEKLLFINLNGLRKYCEFHLEIMASFSENDLLIYNDKIKSRINKVMHKFLSLGIFKLKCNF